MKTNPSSRIPGKPSHHPSDTPGNHRDRNNTIRLSDNAFYLIALASLLKKTVEPGSLQELLQPGAASGIGNSPAC